MRKPLAVSVWTVNDTEALPWKPRETYAACVHAGPYGTKSSAIIMGKHDVWIADGKPCTTPFVRVAL